MSKELIDALKGTRREQVDLSLGQVPLGNSIAKAGNYNVVVAPVASSNELTQIASALSRVSPLLSEFGRYQMAEGRQEASQLTLEEVIRRVEAGDTEAEGLLKDLGKQKAFSQNVYRRYNTEKILPAFQAKRDELKSLTPEQLLERGITTPTAFNNYARSQFAGIAGQFKEFVSKDRFMAQLHNDYLERSIPAEASALAGAYTKNVRQYNKDLFGNKLKDYFNTYSDAGTNGKYSEEFVDFIKEREGFTPKSEWDNKQFSVGYGTRATKAGVSITRAEADKALREELDTHYEKVTEIIEEFDGELALNNNQIMALTSLSFNSGPGNVRKLLTGSKDKGAAPLRDIETIKKKWLKYTKSNRPDERTGLKNRRVKELALFNTPIPEDRKEQEGEGAIVGKQPLEQQAQDKIHNITKEALANPDVSRFETRELTENSFLAGLFHLANAEGKVDEAYELLEAAKQKKFKFSYAEDSPNLFTGSAGEAKLQNAESRLDAINARNEEENEDKAKERRERAVLLIDAEMRRRKNEGEDTEAIIKDLTDRVTNKFNEDSKIPGNSRNEADLFTSSMNAIDEFSTRVNQQNTAAYTSSERTKKKNLDTYGRINEALTKGNEALEWQGVVERVRGLPAEDRDNVFQAKEVDPLDMKSFLGTEDQDVRARAVQLWRQVRAGKLAELERELHKKAPSLEGATQEEKDEWETNLVETYDREIFEDFIDKIAADRLIQRSKEIQEEMQRGREAIEAQQKTNTAPVDTNNNLNLPKADTTWENSYQIVENLQYYEKGKPRFSEAFGDKDSTEIKQLYLSHRKLQERSFEQSKIRIARSDYQIEDSKTAQTKAWRGRKLRGVLVEEYSKGKTTDTRAAEAHADFRTVIQTLGMTPTQAKTKLFKLEDAHPSGRGLKTEYSVNLEEMFDLDEINTSKRFIYNIEALYDEKLRKEIASVYGLNYAEFTKNQREIAIRKGLLESE